MENTTSFEAMSAFSISAQSIAFSGDGMRVHNFKPGHLICKALPYMSVLIEFLLWLVLQNHFLN